MTTDSRGEPARLGEHRWLLPYRTRSEPARLTAWAEAQLDAGVVDADDRDRLVTELRRWTGTPDPGERSRPRHTA